MSIFLLFFLLSLVGCDNQPIPPNEIEKDSLFSRADKFYFMNVTRSHFNKEGDKYFESTAQSIIHRNKLIGHLTINLFKEIEANNVYIKITEQDNEDAPESDESNLFSTIKENVINLSTDETISEIKVNKIHIDFINHKSIKMLSSGQVRFDAIKSKLSFNRGLIVNSKSNSRLIAKDAIWDNKKMKLFIPGNYIILNGSTVFDKGRFSFININSEGISVAK